MYKIKSWPTEEHSPNWTASHRHLRFVKKKETPGTNSFRRREVIRETSIPYTLSRRFESRNHYILLHSTDTIHTQREEEKNQSKRAIGCCAVLFGFRKELKNYGLSMRQNQTHNSCSHEKYRNVLLNRIATSYMLRANEESTSKKSTSNKNWNHFARFS